MPHHSPLIATIVIGLGLAFVLGALANRLRVSPLVGYLLAGVLIGPATPGYVADTELARDLVEIGVILLMFGVGLHFSLKDLLSVRGVTAANISQAAWLFVAIPEAFEAGQIVSQARAASPSLQIIVRAHADAELEHLRGLGASSVS